MKKRKIIKRILVCLLALITIIIAGAYSMFSERIQAALSVKKLEDTLYCMEFKGNYGFDRYLEQGGAPTDSQMASYIISFLSNGFWKENNLNVDKRNFGCSALKAQTEDGAFIYGRNYDWEPCDTMLVHTIPKEGFESVSTCCLDFLGFGEDWIPQGFGNQFMSIASIYVPLDGMNEKGVVIADLMAGDRVETHQDTFRPDITTTAAIRLVLDHAASVDEAVNLLSQYDMNSAIESAHHFYLADQNGKSVVVEYIDNEMIVTETNALTNHYLARKKNGVGSENSHGRFDKLTEDYEKAEGNMSMEEITSSMRRVSCGAFPDAEDTTEKTDWTCCYNTRTLTVEYYYLENYDHKYTLKLGKGSEWVSK